MSSNAPTPLAPLQQWPIHFFDKSFGFVWYCPGHILLTQCIVPHADLDSAKAYCDAFDRAVNARPGEPLAAVHDWRVMRSYANGVRPYIIERAAKRPAGHLKSATVCVNDHPLLRMAIGAFNLASALRGSGNVRLATDFERAMREGGVTMPRLDSRFPP